MALPGHRRTSSDKRRRSAHFGLKKKTLGACANCKQPVVPHRACQNCGSYRGKTIIDTTRAAMRAASRARSSAPAAAEAPKKAKVAKAPAKKASAKTSEDTSKA
jgi:large subunit ribosomal protein L32